MERTRMIVTDLSNLTRPNPPDTVVIELPEAWGTPKGIRASTSGAVSKLAFAVGAIWYWSLGVAHRVYLLTARQWKGQIPKSVTRKRLLTACLITSEASPDEADAVGLLEFFTHKYGR